MRTTAATSTTGQQAASEELSWDAPVTFQGESRAPREDEPARGFLIRLHSDETCPSRLVPAGALVARRYERVKAETLCAECTGPLIVSSHSSVVRRLRDAERTLQSMRGRGGDGPMPREIVHCRALRFEAESAVSVHPEVPALAARVADLASDVCTSLLDAMAAYDRRR